MSRGNPKAAIDALLESTVRVGSLEVHPLTVARYALLDLIDSPFIDFSKRLDISNAIPSVYVMALPSRELAKYDSSTIDQLKQDAFEWAEDALTGDSIVQVLDRIAKKLLDLKRIAPEVVEDSKKKVEATQPTDG